MRVRHSPIIVRHQNVELLGRYSNQHQIVTQLSILLDLPDREVDKRPRSRSKRARRLGGSDQLAVATAYLAGDSLPVIAERYAITRQTVSSILERHGVPRRYNLFSERDIDKAVELYRAGHSLATVGGQLCVNATTVLNAFKRQGITTRHVGTNQWS